MKSTNLKQCHSLLITHSLLILHSLLTLISIEEDFHQFIKIKDPLDSPFHQDHQQGAFMVHNFILHSPCEPQESELLLTNEAMFHNVCCVDLIIIGQMTVLERAQGPSGKALLLATQLRRVHTFRARLTGKMKNTQPISNLQGISLTTKSSQLTPLKILVVNYRKTIMRLSYFKVTMTTPVI